MQKSCEKFSEFYDGGLKILISFNWKMFTTTANIYYFCEYSILINYAFERFLPLTTSPIYAYKNTPTFLLSGI